MLSKSWVRVGCLAVLTILCSAHNSVLCVSPTGKGAGQINHCCQQTTIACIHAHREGKDPCDIFAEKKKIVGEGLEPQLKREVSIMLGLSHPNIVQIIEVFILLVPMTLCVVT